MDGADPRLIDVDSSGIYFHMGFAPTGTEYEVAFLSADGETLNSVRKITPLVYQVPLAFAATSSYVFLFGRVNPGLIPTRFAVWRMTKGSFDLRYREYSGSIGDAPRRAVRLSDTQILMAFKDRLLWLNDDLSVDTLNAYTGGDTIFDLVYNGGNIYSGGVRFGDDPFYAKINSSKSVDYSRVITLPVGVFSFAMDVSGDRLVFVADFRYLVCIDLATHSVLWAKAITSAHRINDVLIDGSQVICVGHRPSGGDTGNNGDCKGGRSAIYNHDPCYRGHRNDDDPDHHPRSHHE